MNVLATINMLTGVLVVGACTEKFGKIGFSASTIGYVSATLVGIYFLGI